MGLTDRPTGPFDGGRGRDGVGTMNPSCRPTQALLDLRTTAPTPTRSPPRTG